jgi:hypothetical protein
MLSVGEARRRELDRGGEPWWMDYVGIGAGR